MRPVRRADDNTNTFFKKVNQPRGELNAFDAFWTSHGKKRNHAHSTRMGTVGEKVSLARMGLIVFEVKWVGLKATCTGPGRVAAL